MVGPSLRERLERLQQPVEVDAIEGVVDAAVRTGERTADGLVDRMHDMPAVLAETAEDTRKRAETVATINEQTSQGVLATLMASHDEDSVVRTRERAASSLSGSLGVLETRLVEARSLGRQATTLMDDARFGVEVLEGLADRAARGGLEAGIVGTIRRAAASLTDLPGRVAGLEGLLLGPIAAAEETADAAAGVLANLRGTEVAATVGEALYDRVAPRWMPGRARDAVDPARVEAQVAAERASARTRARRDAEARAAAMAELDALDD